MLFQTFPLNTAGRDFVVGDLHGEYDEVLAALRAVGFDRRSDRLFSVGDLVDRGAGSPRCLAFLDQPWTHAIRGNHEDMFLDLYAAGEPGEGAFLYVTGHNGMRWFRDVPPAERPTYVAAWRKLPVAIEIETTRGRVGIVHGEVPIGMHWDAFRAGIEAGDAELIRNTVWGRTRIQRGDTSGVAGIDRVFVGHTPVGTPTRLGNIYYIDTGLVFGKLKSDPAAGRLSFHGLTDATQVLSAPTRPAAGYLDLRAGTIPETPFGRYAVL